MRVAAKCIEFAWDSQATMSYEPDQGPLPGGLYEIDSDSQLATLTTLRGLWIFQFSGHEGKDPAFDQRRLKQVNRDETAPAEVAPKMPKDKRHQKMSEEHKAKMIAGRAKKKAEKMARLQEAAA